MNKDRMVVLATLAGSLALLVAVKVTGGSPTADAGRGVQGHAWLNSMECGRKDIVKASRGAGNLGHVTPGARFAVVACSGWPSRVSVEWGDRVIAESVMVGTYEPVVIEVPAGMSDPVIPGEAVYLLPERPMHIAYGLENECDVAALCPMGLSPARAVHDIKEAMKNGETPDGWHSGRSVEQAEE